MGQPTQKAEPLIRLRTLEIVPNTTQIVAIIHMPMIDEESEAIVEYNSNTEPVNSNSDSSAYDLLVGFLLQSLISLRA